MPPADHMTSAYAAYTHIDDVIVTVTHRRTVLAYSLIAIISSALIPLASANGGQINSFLNKIGIKG